MPIRAGRAAQRVLRACCWGTRGSLPSPGPHTARFGGNTSCLHVETPQGRSLIFDAGSGIRRLGDRLAVPGRSVDVDIFLTHFHWDHIQGLPFFGPLYDPEARLRLHGARQGDVDMPTLVAGQMGPVYFPIPYEAVAAQLSFHHLDEEDPRVDGVAVDALRVRHAAHTYGYRISAGEARLAFIPDNELRGGHYPVAEGWYDELVRFLDGVDVLFHDAMYTSQEYEAHVGWGHSSFEDAVTLAERAGVRRLYLFHHAPERSDDELDRAVERLRDDVARRGGTLEVHAAAEGQELTVSAGLLAPGHEEAGP